MAVKFANLASSTLSGAITNSATSITVSDASSFPTLGSGDYFYASLGEGIGSEIVKVTAISTNTLTVTRGQDGTSAQAWSSGTVIALRVVAAALDDIASQAQTAADTESVSIDGDTMTGDLSFGDNNKAIFGSSDSLRIFHDGTTGHIRSTTSNIELRVNGGGNFKVGDEFGNHYLIVNDNSDVQLYHGQPQTIKLATSATGISVSGALGFATNFTNPTNSTAVFYNQSSVGPTASGYKFQVRTGSTPAAAITVDNSQNTQLHGTLTSGAITSSGTVTAEDEIHLTDASTVRAKLLLNASDRDNVELRAESLGSTMKFFTVGTQALLLDASQNATFAGTISSGAITTSGNLVLDSSGYNYIELHSSATNTRKWRFYNGQHWNQDALLIYDQDADSTVLTIETNKLGVNRGAASLSHNLDVGGTVAISGTQIIDGSRNLTNIGTISSGAITSSAGLTFSTRDAGIITFGSSGANPSWSAPKIWREDSHLALSDYSGVKLGGYNGTAYGPRLHVNGNGNVDILEGALRMGTTTVIDSSRNLTNIGTISSGAITSSGNLNLSNGDLQLNGTTRISNAGNATLGTIYANSGATLVLNSSFNYGVSIYHGDTGTNVNSDALSIRRTSTTGTKKVQIGLITNDTDGTHHRGHIYAQRDTIDYGGKVVIRVRSSASGYDDAIIARYNGDVEFPNGDLKIGSTTFIDSGRNLLNIVNSTSTGLISNIRTSAFSPNDSGAGLRLEYSGGDATNEIGSGIVFAQRWYNQSTNNVRTGGIAGFKGAGSGAFGGGLKFYTQPQSGADMNLALTLDKDKNAIFTGIAKGMTHLELLNNGGSDGTATSPRLYSPASGTLAISANGGERGRFNSTGLTVTGEIYATNSSSNLVIGNSASGNIYLGGGNNNTSNIYLQTGSNTAVSINSSNQSTFHGDVVIQAGLTVQGTTTTIDTANLNVEDNNITLNYSTGDSSASANGAGITIQDAVNGSTDAFMNWNGTHDLFNFSHSATFGYTTIDPDSFSGTSGGFGNIADGGGWSARGLYIHGGATGDAAAIGHNGAALYFGIQNNSTANSMATWLDVQPNKQTTFHAQLNVSGHGNSSQWNQAYNWGDHASAGYLTASSTQTKYLRSDTSDIMTFNTTSGEMLKFANNTSGGQIQIGFQQNDTDGMHHRMYIRARKEVPAPLVMWILLYEALVVLLRRTY